MNDKQRAEFEKWAKSDGFQMDVDKYGSYKSLCTWAAWKAWQAAIASVIVELPKPITDEYKDGETIEYYESDPLKDALNSAGLKCR